MLLLQVIVFENVHSHFPHVISMLRRSRCFFVRSFPRSGVCPLHFLHAISMLRRSRCLCVVSLGRTCVPCTSSSYFHVAAFTLCFFVRSFPTSGCVPCAFLVLFPCCGFHAVFLCASFPRSGMSPLYTTCDSSLSNKELNVT
jgi:hypothetical protein